MSQFAEMCELSDDKTEISSQKPAFPIVSEETKNSAIVKIDCVGQGPNLGQRWTLSFERQFLTIAAMG